jgi:hypothetical protein
MIQEIKKQIIETIQSVVNTQGKISIDGKTTDLLDSITYYTSQESYMLDGLLEIEVDETGVKYVCTEFAYGEEGQEQSVKLEDLDLIQLSLILQKS